MCVCVYVHVFIYIYMCVCVCMCMYLYIYIYVCVCMCIYVYLRGARSDALILSAEDKTLKSLINRIYFIMFKPFVTGNTQMCD